MEISNENVIPNETGALTAEVTPETAPVASEPALPVEGAAPPVEAYKPDFTYRVATDVKEFDPRLKGLIKTKEDEQWARELVTRAEGLEINKKSLETTTKELTEYKTRFEKEFIPLKKDADQVLQMAEKKDLLSLASVFGFEQKDILDLAYQLVTLEELPPHQRKAYNERNELSRSQYTLRQQNEDMQRELETIRLTQRKTELTNILNSNDYSSIVKDFDSRNGQSAFWNEVVTRGASYAQLHGKVKEPQELITEIINVYGLKRETPKPVVSSGQGALPVIPNTGSSGVAPVMKKPKTLNELKAYAKTLED
jgi:hypothetical protein